MGRHIDMPAIKPDKSEVMSDPEFPLPRPCLDKAWTISLYTLTNIFNLEKLPLQVFQPKPLDF